MSQQYNDNLKSDKSMHFAGKFSRGPWVQERALLMLQSICLRIHPKT